jgi:hypothetical protein
VGVFFPQAIEIGLDSLRNRIVGALGATAKTIENDEENRRGLHEEISIA